MARLKHFALALQHAVAQHVLQLAHISRPAILPASAPSPHPQSRGRLFRRAAQTAPENASPAPEYPPSAPAAAAQRSPPSPAAGRAPAESVQWTASILRSSLVDAMIRSIHLLCELRPLCARSCCLSTCSNRPCASNDISLIPSRNSVPSLRHLHQRRMHPRPRSHAIRQDVSSLPHGKPRTAHSHPWLIACSAAPPAPCPSRSLRSPAPCGSAVQSAAPASAAARIAALLPTISGSLVQSAAAGPGGGSGESRRS